MPKKFKLFTGLSETETEKILNSFSYASFAKKEQIIRLDLPSTITGKERMFPLRE